MKKIKSERERERDNGMGYGWCDGSEAAVVFIFETGILYCGLCRLYLLQVCRFNFFGVGKINLKDGTNERANGR